jgi:hypothetical protein
MSGEDEVDDVYKRLKVIGRKYCESVVREEVFQ